MTSRTVSLVAGAAASLIVVTTAFAAEPGMVQSTRVGYADLNLASEAGANRLYTRLRRASRQVCALSLFYDSVDVGCAIKALDGAVTAVGNERLTALHLRRKGASQPDASNS
jgi:UrcA family protein